MGLKLSKPIPKPSRSSFKNNTNTKTQQKVFQEQYQYQNQAEVSFKTNTNIDTPKVSLSIPISKGYRKYRKFSISKPKWSRNREVSHSECKALSALGLAFITDKRVVTSYGWYIGG